MNVMSLDLELNQPSNSVIQIGVVYGSIYTKEIYEKKDWIIKVDKEVDPINPRITDLTSITQEMVDNGTDIATAYNEMTALYNKYECSLNMVVWGGGDRWCLQKALQALGDKMPKWEYGHREYDVKTLFQAFTLGQRVRNRSGLAKAMTRVGLQFKGRPHWAPDDSENTFQLFCFLLDKMPKDVVIK